MSFCLSFVVWLIVKVLPTCSAIWARAICGLLRCPTWQLVCSTWHRFTATDAAGVGLLVELREWAAAKRMQLKLLFLTPHVANLLNITHVTPIFDVCSVRDVIDLLFRPNQSVVRKTAPADLPQGAH